MRNGTEDRLLALAEDQDGYFALKDAVAAGVPAPLILQLHARGRLERLTRGVYRIARFPVSSRGDLWAAVLWPRGSASVTGVLSGETALLLHGGTDVNPSLIHVTLPKRSRFKRRAPAPIVLHFDNIDSNEIELIDGLPVTTAQRTLHDLRADPTQSRYADAFERWLKGQEIAG
ncbi:MAG: type IV toxin-antitoxin system AbiEi family antitoxin domain-containing protein [Candidatus Cybelea sp.]